MKAWSGLDRSRHPISDGRRSFIEPYWRFVSVFRAPGSFTSFGFDPLLMSC
jgi:hypothetical protein